MDHIQSKVLLTPEQQKDFDRLALGYRATYNYLLKAWSKKVKSDELYLMQPYMGIYLNRKLKNFLSFSTYFWPGEKGVAYCCLRQLLVDLQAALKRCDTLMFLKTDSEKKVVFYKQFRLNIRGNSVFVPVLGEMPTGRFPYFKGSVQAVGIEQEGDQIVCKAYHVGAAEVSKAVKSLAVA